MELNELMFYNGRQLTPLSKSLNEVYFNKTKSKDFLTKFPNLAGLKFHHLDDSFNHMTFSKR